MERKVVVKNKNAVHKQQKNDKFLNHYKPATKSSSAEVPRGVPSTSKSTTNKLNAAKSTNLIRKPSIKKPPEIRQTKTSKYRLLLANPLLKAEELGVEPVKFLKYSSCKTTDNFVALPDKNAATVPAAAASSGNHQQRTNNKPTTTVKGPADTDDAVTIINELSIPVDASSPINQKQQAIASVHFKETPRPPPVVRRSFSSDNLLSIRNNKTPKTSVSSAVLLASCGGRCRQSSTPNLGQLERHRSNGFTSTAMTRQLENWLKNRGKSPSEFRHLKCFGLDGDVLKHYQHQRRRFINNNNKKNEENKENIEAVVVDSGSYEDLAIVNEDKDEQQEQQPDASWVDLNVIAKEALIDLHKLINEGYCREQCEKWLELISDKYPDINEEAQYWECRAALEQSRDHLTSAIECYKTAIIQGAEVKSVDESLDNLLQKFGLLNINLESKETNKQEVRKKRIFQDARNIFKSTIIQFAVLERQLKKNKNNQQDENVNVGDNNKKQFIATPVRRSTRLSRSRYTSTPGVNLYTSLQQIDETIVHTMEFHHNNALK